jgi:hypothetical protein
MLILLEAFPAALSNVRSSHGPPSSRAHFKALELPKHAADEQVSASHGKSLQVRTITIQKN